ncbi:MAG TPA: ABC transporter permease subunit [Candidatus Limnocylindrales bacterium]|nr:ABC transporter permease subunit [Candidatus Limnocylindrales bacterium]
MNLAYFIHLWRANRVRLLIVTAALVLWGSLLPIIYDAFGQQFKDLMASGLIPQQMAQFGGGDIFSLTGSVALGFIHPFAVALNLVFSVGFAGAAIAGERQRGTLEVLLARPISRRRAYATALVATALFVSATVAGLTLGALAGTAATGRIDELGPQNLPLLWLNAVLLYMAFAAVALAASVSFDRLTPALGIALAFVLVSYFLEALGSLWPDAAYLQDYSLFHYLDARGVLTGLPEARNFAILAAVALAAVAYALVMFPRRDLAAPS